MKNNSKITKRIAAISALIVTSALLAFMSYGVASAEKPDTFKYDFSKNSYNSIIGKSYAQAFSKCSEYYMSQEVTNYSNKYSVIGKSPRSTAAAETIYFPNDLESSRSMGGISVKCEKLDHKVVLDNLYTSDAPASDNAKAKDFLTKMGYEANGGDGEDPNAEANTFCYYVTGTFGKFDVKDRKDEGDYAKHMLLGTEKYQTGSLCIKYKGGKITQLFTESSNPDGESLDQFVITEGKKKVEVRLYPARSGVYEDFIYTSFNYDADGKTITTTTGDFTTQIKNSLSEQLSSLNYLNPCMDDAKFCPIINAGGAMGVSFLDGTESVGQYARSTAINLRFTMNSDLSHIYSEGEKDDTIIDVAKATWTRPSTFYGGTILSHLTDTNRPGLNETEKILLYQHYLKTSCEYSFVDEDNGGEKITLFNHDGSAKEEKYIANAGNGSSVAKVDGNGYFSELISCQDLLAEYQKLELPDTLDVDTNDISNPDADPDADYSTEQDCYDIAGNVAWIVCPAIESLSSFTSNITTSIYAEPMRIKIFADTSDSETLYKVWSYFQGIANMFIVVALLIILISQTTGIGIGNYGIKKMLPRLVTGALMVNLSYYFCAGLADISNIAGGSMQRLFAGSVSSIAQHYPKVRDFFADGAIGIFSIVAAFGTTAASLVALFGFSGVTLAIVAIIMVIIGVATAIMHFIIIGGMQAAIVVLAVVSPIAFACNILPNTSGIYKKWFTLFRNIALFYPMAMLVIYGSQMAAVVVDTTGEHTFLVGFISAIPFFILPGMLKNANREISGRLGQLSNSLSRTVKGAPRSINGMLSNGSLGEASAAFGAGVLGGTRFGRGVSNRLSGIQGRYNRSMAANKARRELSRKDQEDAFKDAYEDAYYEGLNRPGNIQRMAERRFREKERKQLHENALDQAYLTHVKDRAALSMSEADLANSAERDEIIAARKEYQSRRRASQSAEADEARFSHFNQDADDREIAAYRSHVRNSYIEDTAKTYMSQYKGQSPADLEGELRSMFANNNDSAYLNNDDNAARAVALIRSVAAKDVGKLESAIKDVSGSASWAQMGQEAAATISSELGSVAKGESNILSAYAKAMTGLNSDVHSPDNMAWIDAGDARAVTFDFNNKGLDGGMHQKIVDKMRDQIRNYANQSDDAIAAAIRNFKVNDQSYSGVDYEQFALQVGDSNRSTFAKAILSVDPDSKNGVAFRKVISAGLEGSIQGPNDQVSQDDRVINLIREQFKQLSNMDMLNANMDALSRTIDHLRNRGGAIGNEFAVEIAQKFEEAIQAADAEALNKIGENAKRCFSGLSYDRPDPSDPSGGTMHTYTFDMDREIKERMRRLDGGTSNNP